MESKRPKGGELDTVYSNFDHLLDEEIAKQLESNSGKVYAQHAAWDFCGYIWHDDGKWYDETLVLWLTTTSIRRRHHQGRNRAGTRPARAGVSACKHNKSHKATVGVGFLEDSGRFTAEVRIECADCGRPFQFINLPIGLDLQEGATMSVS